jgi:hypothetical protein
MLLTEAKLAAEGVKGWLSLVEQSLLYDLACQVPAEGTIVELGSWMGRSTILLAAGSLSKPRATVYAVDLFANVGVTSNLYQPFLDAEDPDYLPRFEENIRGAGVDSIVVPIRGETTEAAARWDGPPIDLLFIDADHSFEGVRRDFLAWAPHCRVGARCAFHDYFSMTSPGVRQFVDGLIAAGIVRDLATADSILHGTLTVTDRAEIDSRLKRRRLGWHRVLFRPAKERRTRHDFALFHGGAALEQGNRSQALRHGAEALWWRPLGASGWRFLAQAATKPKPSKPTG